MSAVAFDTLRYLEKLTEAGISDQQAKALTMALTEAVDMNLATKSDLRNLKNELILKLGGISVISITVVASIVKFL